MNYNDEHNSVIEEEEEEQYDCDECCENVDADHYAGCCNDGDCPRGINDLCTHCGAWDDAAQVWRCSHCAEKAAANEPKCWYCNAGGCDLEEGVNHYHTRCHHPEPVEEIAPLIVATS